MATFKQIDQLVVGDKILCLDWNNEPIILTVTEVLPEDNIVFTDKYPNVNSYLPDGYYCVTEELDA